MTEADERSLIDQTEPFPKNGPGDGSKTCARCGSDNDSDAGRCASCQSWLTANQGARKHGSFAKYQPDDILLSADELLMGVLSDKGGAAEMPTLQRSLAAKLAGVDILINLNKQVIVAEGVETPAGRKAHDRYLQALDRFVQFAGLLGLQREAKRVDLARALSGLSR